jgi:hypothetical protein
MATDSPKAQEFWFREATPVGKELGGKSRIRFANALGTTRSTLIASIKAHRAVC